MLIIGLIFSFAQISCNKEKKQAKKDEELIKEYVEKNKLDAKKTDEGIYYVIQKEGTPPNPNVNSVVLVEYKGLFLDGSIFDQSTSGDPIKGALSGFIEGWKIGIPLFKVGGEGILIIPSKYAYGPRGSGGIPPNEVLRFDIKLVGVQ